MCEVSLPQHLLRGGKKICVSHSSCMAVQYHCSRRHERSGGSYHLDWPHRLVWGGEGLKHVLLYKVIGAALQAVNSHLQDLTSTILSSSCALGLQIVPQSICTRHGLSIGAALIPVVKIFTCVASSPSFQPDRLHLSVPLPASTVRQLRGALHHVLCPPQLRPVSHRLPDIAGAGPHPGARHWDSLQPGGAAPAY